MKWSSCGESERSYWRSWKQPHGLGYTTEHESRRLRSMQSWGYYLVWTALAIALMWPAMIIMFSLGR